VPRSQELAATVKSRLSFEDRDRLDIVRVLMRLVLCEVDSTTLPSTQSDQLNHDIEGIAPRFQRLLLRDERVSRQAQQRAKRRKQRKRKGD
jgi:hypothetical protein